MSKQSFEQPEATFSSMQKNEKVGLGDVTQAARTGGSPSTSLSAGCQQIVLCSFLQPPTTHISQHQLHGAACRCRVFFLLFWLHSLLLYLLSVLGICYND